MELLDVAHATIRLVSDFGASPTKGEAEMTAKVTKLHPATKRASEIKMYFHCALCIEELPEGTSPQEYRHTESGWTEKGFQVWCLRHNANIVHMDFEGHKHPAC